MPLQELICPACGAPLPKKFRFTRMIVCEYCNNTILLNADSLEAVKQKVLLADYDSFVKIHSFFHWGDNLMEIIGRVRYQYEAGFWDEWLLVENSKDQYWWLHEDEGDFAIFIENPEEETEKFYTYEELKIGSEIYINDFLNKVFLCEKAQATIAGFEGEIPYVIAPSQTMHYVDGIYKGKMVSLEYIGDKCYIYVGIPISAKAALESLKKSLAE
ncbi:MAG: DUF4178 domain-containing protein [Bacteroidia bacterium]|nr:DUF4178 domain-containing protein [Bacteroidia bacterium]MDW8157903.1 DUF4178 domain-containing protein [Bacteroidia bacterium]